MLDTITLIETALSGKTRADFGKDDILRLAIQRAIEILSRPAGTFPTNSCPMPRTFRGVRSVVSATSCAMNIIALPTT